MSFKNGYSKSEEDELSIEDLPRDNSRDTFTGDTRIVLKAHGRILVDLELSSLRNINIIHGYDVSECLFLDMDQH